jgi:hypothetical protein
MDLGLEPSGWRLKFYSYTILIVAVSPEVGVCAHLLGEDKSRSLDRQARTTMQANRPLK